MTEDETPNVAQFRKLAESLKSVTRVLKRSQVQKPGYEGHKNLSFC